MKRILAVLMALMLFASCAFAESNYITAELFTAEKTVDTSTDLYVSAYYGLTQMDIDVNGVTRTMCVYVPESYFPCCDMLLVYAPDGITAEAFANESGWMVLAEEYGFGVAFFEGKDGTWNLKEPEEELAFYQTAVNVFGDRQVIDFGEAALYMIGYGEGASMANIIALSYSSMLAGVVTMGGSDVSQEYIEAVGNEQSFPFAINVDFTTKFENCLNKDVVMPIWIINDGDTNEFLTNYWMTVNRVIDEGLSNAYGRVYMQNELNRGETINNRALSRVWVSDIEGAASYYDHDFEAFIWEDFFTERRRFSSEPNGALRVGYTLDEIGMIQCSFEQNGAKRYYLVYVPSSYDASSPIPMVVACHGHAARAEVYAQHSEWWHIAEERGFIVVFPQGSRCNNHTLCGCTTWRTDEGFIDMELEYMQMLLDEVLENYNIDKQRIYLTGHSMGGLWTAVVAENMPEVFAAAGNVGGTLLVSETLKPVDNFFMPYFAIVGEYDLWGMGDYENTEGRTWPHMQAWLAYNHQQDAVPYVFDTGSYKEYDYYGTQIGIPLTRVLVNGNFHHAYVPQYTYILWDQFFSKFSRGEDGTTYYCGTAVN